MTAIDIRADGCDCAASHCCMDLEQARCVNFISRAGEVRTAHCTTCDAHTWHQKNECLRCKEGPAIPRR